MMIRIKTKEEIEKLREGGRRHARILAEVAAAVRPGVTTQSLDDLAYKLVTEGGDTPSFLGYKSPKEKHGYPATLCVSVNDEIVHGLPRADRVLQEGDIVSVDLGVIHEGMFTDAAVTVPVGKADAASKALMMATKKALDIGIKAARGGATTGDVGAAIEGFVRPLGYGIVEELAGHGVGHAVHEDPYVPNYGKAGAGTKLVPGMVIAIEPMLNAGSRKIILDADGYTYRTVDGSRSAHFEHTVLITEKGAEVLTKA
ncbi:MAG: type I methionyl aminopeptidase [Candidatus Paceibacterota bacterium]|jgi:methionyl aminopeptidase